MALQTISDGETLASIRSKINANATELYALPQMPNIVGTWASVNASALKSTAGNTAFVTDIYKGTLMVTDGSHWRPVGGRCNLYATNGSIASPVVSHSGTASNADVLTLSIPAGLIPPHGTITVDMRCTRSAVAANNVAFTIFLSASTYDFNSNGLVSLNISNTLPHIQVITDAMFAASTTSFVSGGSLVMNTASSSTSQADRSTYIDTTAAMNLNVRLNAPVGETFKIIGYTVILDA